MKRTNEWCSSSPTLIRLYILHVASHTPACHSRNGGVPFALGFVSCAPHRSSFCVNGVRSIHICHLIRRASLPPSLDFQAGTVNSSMKGEAFPSQMRCLSAGPFSLSYACCRTQLSSLRAACSRRAVPIRRERHTGLSRPASTIRSFATTAAPAKQPLKKLDYNNMGVEQIFGVRRARPPAPSVPAASRPFLPRDPIRSRAPLTSLIDPHTAPQTCTEQSAPYPLRIETGTLLSFSISIRTGEYPEGTSTAFCTTWRATTLAPLHNLFHLSSSHNHARHQPPPPPPPNHSFRYQRPFALPIYSPSRRKST